MNIKQAKDLLPIFTAFAEGKQIQEIGFSGKWVDLPDCVLNFEAIRKPEEYRIKPEPTYRPFKDAEECWNEMQKHQPFGWVKYEGFYITIADVKKSVIIFADNENDDYTFNEAFELCTFADGSVFGVKEVEI